MRWPAAALLPLAVLLAPTASADCSGAGDFGAASGCAPPGGGSGSTAQSWPPTSVDWPPQLDSNTDDGTSNGNSDKTTSRPIVLPAGQPAPAATPATASAPPADPPKPIVPAGR
jgi:hypothetical protein